MVGQRSAQRVIVGDDAEGGLVAGLGQGRVGGSTGHHRNTAVVVDLGGRNGSARVQVTDHAGDLGVAQLLRHSSALLRIGGVIFHHGFETDLLAAQRHALLVHVVHGHQHAVGVVLAVVRLAAGHGRHGGNFHHLHVAGTGGSRRGRHGCSGRRGGRCFFLLAAGCQHGSGGQGGSNAQTQLIVHDQSLQI